MAEPRKTIMDTIEELINFDIRHTMFRNAMRFVDYELLPGDVFEFGVYTGRSLALLAHYHYLNKKGIHRVGFSRRIVGIDSFEGLPGSDEHPRWKQGMFRVNHSFHPTCQQGERVSPQVTLELFARYGLPAPIVEVGEFSQILSEIVGTKYRTAAVVHIDCDLYESTRAVLLGIQPILQEGTILLFDDWFNFLGSRRRGEQKAFFEVMESQQTWTYTQYQPYATFGNSFIVSRR
jgi:hypothetical protein